LATRVPNRETTAFQLLREYRLFEAYRFDAI
jgi:hypothetical protein